MKQTGPLGEGAEMLRAGHTSTLGRDPSILLREIAQAGIGAIGTDRCGIYLWEAESEELVVGAEAVTAQWPDMAEPGHRISLAIWPALRAALAERKILCAFPGHPALSDDERNIFAEAGIRGLLAVPLVVDDHCLGLFAAYRRRGHRFVDHDVRIGRELAAQAALTIHNARLLGETRRQATEQAALFRVGQAAISSLDLETVLQEIARTTLGLIDTDCCAIDLWHRDTDRAELVAEEAVPDWAAPARLGRLMPLADRSAERLALEEMTPVQIGEADARAGQGELDEMTACGIKRWLIVPLVVGDTCLGTIRFASRRGQLLDEAAVRLAQEIAAQTALAIQNARHLESARRYAEEQSTLLRLSQVVMSNHDLMAVLTEIARAALALEGVDGCRIAVWRPDQDAVELAADETVDDWSTFYRQGEHLPLADWPSYREAMAHRRIRPFHTNDPDVHARERANLLADGIYSGMVIPIVIGDEGQGFLALHARQRRRFGDAARRFASELAAQAAAAIDRARLIEALQRRAETDGLTGLLNHRAAQEALDRELSLARTAKTPLAVVLLDLDDFKLFNDTHGHQLGDRVLMAAATALRSCARPGDLAARYGGDEFLLILPGATAGTAVTVAKRLLNHISTTTVAVDGMELPIRCSVGAASYPADGRTRQELIAWADAAMYAAKDLGGGTIGEPGQGTRTLEPTAFGALSGLVRAVDRKDRYTKDHSDLVRDYAVACGRALGLSPEKLEALDIAGQLHDVGKIAVPDLILRKPGHLDPEEEATMRQHVVFGELMIKGVPYQADVVAAVAHHHERWDGGGYPYGKSGPEIPLLGRILALADAFEAMTHDRPYRKGRSRQQAVAELRAGAGTQFDPDLVEPFISAVAPDTADRLSEYRASVQRSLTTIGREPKRRWTTPWLARSVTGSLRKEGE
jgi:diguanylate cyclase (GGDEF)-like protein